MSEATFRAVVAVILVAALALALAITASVFRLWPSIPVPTASPAPPPTPTTTAPPTATPTTTAAPTATPTPPPPFGKIDVTSVGLITRGQHSPTTLVLSFLESSPSAIPDAPGSFRLTLTDAAGRSTVAFVGTPVVEAPDSLGARSVFVGSNVLGPNVLEVSIRGSDNWNFELITITGLGISTASTAALGPVRAVLSGFTGSLAVGVTRPGLPSPGTVVAGP
jgi:hypothetical protein